MQSVQVDEAFVCTRARLHAYACSSWQRSTVSLGFGQSVNPSVKAEDRITVWFPSCWLVEPLELCLTAKCLLYTNRRAHRHKTRLSHMQTNMQAYVPADNGLEVFFADKCPVSQVSALSSHKKSWVEDGGETPHQQLDARWLFHVFTSHWRPINHHSLGLILR